MSFDASQARFIRKRHAEQGLDQEEQEEQRQFGQNLQKALDVYGNKNKKKDIESQVQYFGNMIEPFNMREEEDMGDIDQEGYFVFKRRNEYRDAWLESIEEQNDMMVADKVKKRIKTQGVGWKGVYDDDRKNQGDQQMQNINQDERQQNDQDNQNDNQNSENNKDDKQQQSQQQQEQNKLTLQPSQIKQLICQLLPMDRSANAYIKELKKRPKKDLQSRQLHDKILQLCNVYIEKTNEYDILTLKKEQLELQVDQKQGQASQQLNWDDDEAQSSQKAANPKMTQNNTNQANNFIGQNTKKMQTEQRNNQHHQLSYQNDDIF